MSESGDGTWTACARGELALAGVLGIPREALDAARDLGRWAAAQGDRALAKRLLEGVVALDARDVDARLELAEIALAEDAPLRALELAGEALAAGGGELGAPSAAMAFARALAANGHRDDARAWAARLAARDVPEPLREAARRLSRA